MLHGMGQRLWLDNITRGMIDSGTLRRYIEEHSITGLTSNPTIFDNAIKGGNDYDPGIRKKVQEGKSGEALFLELAIEDIQRAADLFRPIHDRTAGVDGWVSIEVSPHLAYDAKKTLAMAQDLHTRVARPNAFIKIPGTKEGQTAIEEAIFSGIPVNVTLLFSREHYLAAAESYLRGLERRVTAGMKPDVASVASLFVSRWDVAVSGKVPETLRNRLGIGIVKRTYAASRVLHASPRWRSLESAGARPQRPLWASTGTKDPAASPVLYVDGLGAPGTVNTMPEATLLALAKLSKVGPPLPEDGGDCERVLAEFTKAGVDLDALAAKLQSDGAQAFVKSWDDLLGVIATKSASLVAAG
jgi:transaldolase